MKRLASLLILSAALAGSCAPAPSVRREAGPSSTSQDVTQRLRQLAASTSHFATADIINNHWSEQRWPPELRHQQESLLAALKSMRNDRDGLRAALGDVDPKVRTLALGALFVREDPRDLPLIAASQADSATTFPELHWAADSRLAPLPLERFESAQSVGNVATKMIRFYLDAAFESYSFDQYWAAHGSRQRSASWFLAKMRRATRRTSPLQPQYEADVARVLAEINALPAVERAWTLLYVREGLVLSELSDRIPDSTMIAALEDVSPDALVKFLRREPVSDDPDLRPELGGTARAGITYSMIRFILTHPVDLLRPSDSEVVLAEWNRDPVHEPSLLWVSATAQLRGLDDMSEAVNWLKERIASIPLKAILAQTDQAHLATTLWRMRGSAEKDYLTNWFYSVLPGAQLHGSHGPQEFLRGMQKYSRRDTDAMLAAIVNDSRFDGADWGTLAEILQMVNRGRDTPLVDRRTIGDYWPPVNHPDQAEALAAWRQMLRQHFRRVP